MLKELAEAGIPPMVIENYLEKKIRPTESLSSSEPPILELEIMDLFEKEN
jgi:hypothetical protein